MLFPLCLVAAYNVMLLIVGKVSMSFLSKYLAVKGITHVHINSESTSGMIAYGLCFKVAFPAQLSGSIARQFQPVAGWLQLDLQVVVEG